jgi:hypothetical protein
MAALLWRPSILEQALSAQSLARPCGFMDGRDSGPAMTSAKNKTAATGGDGGRNSFN